MTPAAKFELGSSRVTFLVQRVGPYHRARLRALAGLVGTLSVIEFRPADAVYAWETLADSGAHVRVVLRATAELEGALERTRPHAIVCVGYSDPEIHRATRWALRRNLALVVCSDSNLEDDPRRMARELVKRILLSAFGAALVAGSRSDAYLDGLGVPAGMRFRPWDVVDNRHFALGADAARGEAAARRAALGLPPEYFFCSARFVPKKNLGGLLQAYRG
jgi:hypothetical protein